MLESPAVPILALAVIVLMGYVFASLSRIELRSVLASHPAASRDPTMADQLVHELDELSKLVHSLHHIVRAQHDQIAEMEQVIACSNGHTPPVSPTKKVAKRKTSNAPKKRAKGSPKTPRNNSGTNLGKVA